MGTPVRVLWWLAWASYVVVAGWFLLDPSPAHAVGGVNAVVDLVGSWTGIDVPPERAEFVVNVAVFVPLPSMVLLDPRRRWSPWAAAAGGVALSLLVEMVQGLFLPNRSAELVDVVANSLGVALGAIACWWLARSRRDRPLRDGRDLAPVAHPATDEVDTACTAS